MLKDREGNELGVGDRVAFEGDRSGVIDFAWPESTTSNISVRDEANDTTVTLTASQVTKVPQS